MVAWCIRVLMHDYRKLRVYDMAIEFTSETYRLTKALPHSGRYGLVQQMNRKGVSIASTIAQGTRRGDRRNCARFGCITRGSRCEVVDRESVRVLCERLEKLNASLTNLGKRMSPP